MSTVGSTRVLGIDFGTRRVGAAVSDPRRKIATPLEVYERKDPAQDARHYRNLVAEHDIDLIVIGLPLHTSGQEGNSAKQARAWGAWIGGETCLKVVYHDERYSTVDAEERLIAAGIKRQGRKEKRDMLAAQILLQDFLDAGCPEIEAAPTPLADPGEAT
jgi:putative Holliday junction resolvase